MAEDWEMRRLIFHEGLRLQPYKDTRGFTTIGVGRCVDTNPFTKAELKAVGDWQHGITQNAALMLLRNDIDRCKKELAGLDFYGVRRVGFGKKIRFVGYVFPAWL